MPKLFSNKKAVTFLVSIIVLIGIIASSVASRNSNKAPNIFRQLGNDFVTGVDQIVAIPANALGKSFDNLTDLINTYHENKQLKSQIDELAQTKVQKQTLAEENKALKKELKLQGTLTDYETVTASILSRNPDNWQSTLVINQGSLAGLKKNMPVMANAGMIGRLTEVSKTTAKVTLVSNVEQLTNGFAATIKTKDGQNINGILSGYDNKKKALKVTQLKTDEAIKKGDLVMTSGLGGLTPRGLYIGKVAGIVKDEYGLANSVYVTPAADLNEITVVTVIKRTVEGE